MCTGMTINIVDQTGQPRSDEDLQEAIDTCKSEMAKHKVGDFPPMLMVMFPTIIECLQELQRIRAVIAKHQKETAAGAGQGRHGKF